MGRRGAVFVFALLAVFPSPAGAAFPGQPGKIAFISLDSGNRVTTEYENGAGSQYVTPPDFDAFGPEWSADGQRLVFAGNPRSNLLRDIWVVDEDGTDLAPLTTTGESRNPSWSPDGTKIAFDHNVTGVGRRIFVMNADGTGATPIATGIDPTWSPDGSKIAYATSSGLGSEIRVTSPEGSADAPLIAPPANVGYREPDWSPDGTKLAFTSISGSRTNIEVVRADGTGHQILILSPQGCACESPAWSPDGYFILVWKAETTATIWKLSSAGGFMDRMPMAGYEPSWQPIPGITGYPRPKGASPDHMYLVPAYVECIDPNEQHGPPLAEGSCAPPVRKSAHLTIGTADANGQPTISRGQARLGVLVGDPSTAADEADVQITVEINDVRQAGDLSDYTGELLADRSLRLVDRNNGGTTAATMVDSTYSFAVPCAATTDSSGGLCTLATTADALVPGTAVERARAVWELGALRVFDGGDDEVAATTGDNTLFLVQGIFIP